MASQLRIYVESLNGVGGIPNMQSTWDQVLDNTYSRATEKTLNIYQTLMKNECQKVNQIPLEESDLFQIHDRSFEKALQHFEKEVSSCISDDTNYTERKYKELSQKIYQYSNTNQLVGGELFSFINFNKIRSSSYCDKLIESLKEKYITPLHLENITEKTQMKDIELALQTLENEFMLLSKGPCKMQSWQLYAQWIENELPKIKITLMRINQSVVESQNLSQKNTLQVLENQRIDNEIRNLEIQKEQFLKDKLKELERLRQKNENERIAASKQQEAELETLKRAITGLGQSHKDTIVQKQAEMLQAQNGYESRINALLNNNNQLNIQMNNLKGLHIFNSRCILTQLTYLKSGDY